MPTICVKIRIFESTLGDYNYNPEVYILQILMWIVSMHACVLACVCVCMHVCVHVCVCVRVDMYLAYMLHNLGTYICVYLHIVL